MPRVFRLMRKDDEGLPLVESSARGLGVRVGHDIDVDSEGNAIANGKGMSVNPNWRDMNVNFIPKRLRHLKYGAIGSNSSFCFRRGEGPFQEGVVADGLVLIPDSNTHGVVAPSETMPLVEYEAALAATRSTWLLDES